MTDSIKFTDLDIPLNQLLPGPNTSGPMNRSWVRVRFSIGDSMNAFNEVQEWLKENCPGRWAAYLLPIANSSEHAIVVRFEQKNDALMFKLRGGHQVWQD